MNVKELTAAQKHIVIGGITAGAGYLPDSTCDHCHGAGYDISKHCDDITCSCNNIYTEIKPCPNKCEPARDIDIEIAGNEYLKECQETLEQAIKDGEFS